MRSLGKRVGLECSAFLMSVYHQPEGLAMIVKELISKLQTLPQDAWLDAMFPDDGAAYAVRGVSTLEVKDGRTIAIVEIVDEVPLRAV